MSVSLYKVAKFFMLPTGIWKLPISNNPHVQTAYSIYSVFVLLLYISYTLSMVIRFIELCYELEISQLYVFLTLTILILEINYKILIYLKNGIPQMFAVVINREEIVLKTKEKEILDVYLQQVRYYKFATFCQCFCSFSGITWFILVNLYTKYYVGVNEHFMYELWFPFDKEQHEKFVVFYNILLAYYGFLFNCASQTPLQTLMVFSTSQLRILQVSLRKCCDLEEQPNQDRIKMIKKLIKEHQFLIEFIKDLNAAIQNTIFLEFIVESVHGAGALLQIISVKSMIEIPYASMYLILLVINMSALAWSANEVIVQSTNIANAVYESNWMNQSKEIKQLLFFILERAQKPLSLRIGSFGPMNAEAALMTAKGSYTYAQFVITNRARKK
ncbi:hypothetical protein ABEB36_014794 [Hypothenemus hampei]|uniref:Odorant receptor n=1 Tax=Hypothenemus hampei TaxID=57062 RepID=A0ABD1E0V4_HYPHA